MSLLPEIKNRRSIIVFQERDVEQEKINALIEAARWPPSCFNKQEWNYVLVRKGNETRESFEDALSFGNGYANHYPLCSKYNSQYYAHRI